MIARQHAEEPQAAAQLCVCVCARARAHTMLHASLNAHRLTRTPGKRGIAYADGMCTLLCCRVKAPGCLLILLHTTLPIIGSHMLLCCKNHSQCTGTSRKQSQARPALPSDV